MDHQAASNRLEESLLSIDRAYERYAKRIGLNYTSMYLLYLLQRNTAMTQKQLADSMLLPKQTVNSIVLDFLKQNIVELIPLPEDRRHKAVRLTPAGQAYAGQVQAPIEQADEQAMAQFTPEERAALLLLTERYAHAVWEALHKKAPADSNENT